ncbi:MAG TPA: hypothetical protein DEA95_04615 [Nitrospiraceae bacterium]|nr:hypothetical protein [Nitrospiraceae bacterium]
MGIYAAIILGVFFLSGIILHHWLRSGRSLKIEAWGLKGANASASLHWILFVIASIGYVTFTVLLLTSTGEDQETGVLFILNVIALIIGGILARANKASLSKVYGVGASIQSVILIIMLIKGYGNAEIVMAINISIIVGFGLLAWLYNRNQRVNA